MSLAIDPARINRVLLADGWHSCVQGSFDLDAYEYIERYGDSKKTLMIFGGGQDSQVSSTGFRFEMTSGGWLYGPITSILAIST
jgi:hypothetical protein